MSEQGQTHADMVYRLVANSQSDYATVTATSLHCLCCGWVTPLEAAVRDWEGFQDALECGWCGAVFEYGQRTGFRLQCGKGIPAGEHNHLQHGEVRQ